MLRILGIVSTHLRPSLGPPICRFAALTLALALATPAVAAEVGGDAALRPSGELLDEQEGPERPPPTDAGAPASSEARAGGRDDGRRTLGRFFPNLGRSAIGVFHRDNLGPLVVGTVATGLGSFYDDDVRDHISDPGNGFGKNFEDGASPALVGAAVVGVFVGTTCRRPSLPSHELRPPGCVRRQRDLHDFAQESGAARAPERGGRQVVPVGPCLQRLRPRGGCRAPLRLEGGVPAYALASVVAASRLQRNKHYLSDVLAGATLGYIVGRTVVRVNGAPLEPRRGVTVSVTPLLGRQTRGLMVAVTF